MHWIDTCILYTYYSCGHGISQELLGRAEVENLEGLPDCQLSSKKECNLTETKGIEVHTTLHICVSGIIYCIARNLVGLGTLCWHKFEHIWPEHNNTVENCLNSSMTLISTYSWSAHYWHFVIISLSSVQLMTTIWMLTHEVDYSNKVQS